MEEEESTAREKEGLIDGGGKGGWGTACQAVLSLITARGGLSQTSCPQEPCLSPWSGGWGQGGLLSWQIQGMCIDRPSILVSPGPSPSQIWWHGHLPNDFPTLLQSLYPKLDCLSEPVLQHGSTDPVCCCSGVGIRGQERHLFKAVLSLKPPFHQNLAQEYKKMILCCCLVLAKIQTLLSEKLCAPASHFLSFLLFRHLFIIQTQKPGD